VWSEDVAGNLERGSLIGDGSGPGEGTGGAGSGDDVGSCSPEGEVM